MYSNQNERNQLDFMDVLSICSFVIGLQNLQENMNQNDKQELMSSLDEKTNRILKEIQDHLEKQDDKIDHILDILEGGSYGKWNN